MNKQPRPTDIKLHQQSRILEIQFDDGARFELSCEFLRVHSPSAEVQGHAPGEETLQTGKRQVAIIDIQPVGNYAVSLHFDDGHNTGIYSWSELYRLGSQAERLWDDYLQKLEAAGASRDA